MNQLEYSGSGRVHNLYNEICSSDAERSTDELVEEIRGRLGYLRGAYDMVMEEDQLDLHEFNALYSLYKEAAIWYFMKYPHMVEGGMVEFYEKVGEIVKNRVLEYLNNVYSRNVNLLAKGLEKLDVSKYGKKTDYAIDIMFEAFADARLDMMRWRVAEKLAEYGYMN